MRDAMLITHFIGLAMGMGTSFAFMFLGIAASKMDKDEAVKFKLKTHALGKMGHIGLAILIISGGYLATPYWATIADRPLFMIKLGLVIVLGALIGIISSTAKKAAKGDADLHLAKIELLGKFSMITVITIVVLAVLNFH